MVGGRQREDCVGGGGVGIFRGWGKKIGGGQGGHVEMFVRMAIEGDTGIERLEDSWMTKGSWIRGCNDYIIIGSKDRNIAE